MPIEDTIESLYLRVWRAIVLSVATAALAATLVAGAAAVRGLLVDPPIPPAQLKPPDPEEALSQTYTLDRFKLADRGGAAPQPRDEPVPQNGSDTVIAGVRDIARNLDRYLREAFPTADPIAEATEWTVGEFMKTMTFKTDAERRFYVATLQSLTEQLARVGSEQARLPEERRIDPYRMLRWHAQKVQHTLDAIGYENERLQKVYEQRLAHYTNRNSRVIGYVGIAVGSLTLFVFSIFLFVIIRIERDLRTMAVASVATTRRLES